MTTDNNYNVVLSADRFEQFCRMITEEGKVFGLDIEAGYLGPEREGISLMPFHPDWTLVGFSFTNSTSWARYVPIGHDTGRNVDDPVRTARALWRLLQTNLGVAHNASYELQGLSRWFRDVLWDDPEVGSQVRESNGLFPVFSDTMLEAYLTGDFGTPPAGPGIGLKALTKVCFGHEQVEFKSLFDKPGPKVRFNTLSPVDPAIWQYACEDAVWCLALHQKHYPRMLKPDGTRTLIYKTEMDLLPVLCEMEQAGLALNWGLVHSKSAEVQRFRDQMNEEIMVDLSERLGEVVSINLASTKQLATILFDRLGLPIKTRSEKTSAASTSEKALRAIAQRDPIVKKILEYREVAKLYGSYLKKYDTELNYDPEGRARPNHKQAGAATGRMSVDQVSYQQWPKPYHYELKDGATFDFNFRDLLVSPPGYRIIGYDFSQVELRVLAGLANERGLIQAFNDGTDIHKATASQMMGIPLEKVTKKERANGKTLNFAVVYGSGPGNIAEMLSTPEAPVTKDDAEELLRKYFAAFPALHGWMAKQVEFGRREGYVLTPFGRRFTVWEYRSDNGYIVSKGDRMCVNAPVQGGAADYMKIGMVRAQRAIKAAGLADKIQMVMTVHDALEFYVHESVSTQQVIDLIQPCVSFPVPTLPHLPEILAEWHEGRTWGSVLEITLDAQKKIQHYEWEGAEYATPEEGYAAMEGDSDKPNLPAVEPQAPSQPGPTPDGEPHDAPWQPDHQKPSEDALITVPHMPTAGQVQGLLAYLNEHPGSQSVTLSTPSGDFELPGRYTLTGSDGAYLSLVLGGCYLNLSVAAAA